MIRLDFQNATHLNALSWMNVCKKRLFSNIGPFTNYIVLPSHRSSETIFLFWLFKHQVKLKFSKFNFFLQSNFRKYCPTTYSYVVHFSTMRGGVKNHQNSLHLICEWPQSWVKNLSKNIEENPWNDNIYVVYIIFFTFST